MAGGPPNIPKPGAWMASGGDRAYDWIGPASTLPGVGRVFAMFDQFLPFSNWLRRLRQHLGAGEDAGYRGPQTVVIGDCGLTLTARSMQLSRRGSAYVGAINVAGTIHEMQLEILSPTEMRETWTYSIGTFDQLTAGQQAELSQSGVDPSLLDAPIRLETHAPVTWRYTGPEDAPIDWIAECCAMMLATKVWCHKVRDAYADDALYRSVLDSLPGSELMTPEYIKQQHTDAIWARAKLDKAALGAGIVPSGISMTKFLGLMDKITFAKFLADTTGEPMAQTAGTTDSSGKVTVKDQGNKLAEATVEHHESVHEVQRQAIVDAWDPDGPYADAEDAVTAAYEDPNWYRPAEVEAYESEISFIDDWLAENC